MLRRSDLFSLWYYKSVRKSWILFRQNIIDCWNWRTWSV